MISLGRTHNDNAVQFVAKHATAILGSMSADYGRRVLTSATGQVLEAQRAEFAMIASVTPPTVTTVPEKPQPPECDHRGSLRHTCCGSPDVWICRHLKTDCVATTADAKKLRSMVATKEAENIKVCSTCRHRNKPAADDTWPARETRTDDSLRVGFLSAAYMPIGGTETFHRNLLPRLKNIVDVAGFVATGFHGGDGGKLQVPYAHGVESARELAAHCDIVVVWGIHQLSQILPTNRPNVIAVHHADWSSDWNNNTVLTQLDLIDKVVCVNENTAIKMKSCGKPTFYIPNAIDPQRIKPSGKQSDLRTGFGIHSESRIVLFGHRMSAEKRPLLAVEIARQLPENWTMVIVGDGPQRDAVREASLDCERVRVVDAVESLADWFSISSCFLSLSIFEGFGLSVGEAMAAGLPTVSTPTGIAPGLATTLPLESTPAEWADAIVNARSIVEPAVILERFSVDRMVSSWADVIVKTHQGTPE